MGKGEEKTRTKKWTVVLDKDLMLAGREHDEHGEERVISPDRYVA